MSIRVIETIQARLQDLGYYTGQIDDEPGPLTSQAITRFKEDHGFVARDYAGPLTLALMFSDQAQARDRAADDTPPWYEQGLAHLGEHEVTDNATLKAWLRSDGATLGDPAVLPWCGDFVETCLGLTLSEPAPANPYLARNWLNFGRPCGIVRGAIAVFWRGSPRGTKGHVGFVAGSDATAIHVLGGNQSNTVSIARLDRDRLLGCRWPETYPMTGQTVEMAPDGHLSEDER